jgi:hypothetical protein
MTERGPIHVLVPCTMEDHSLRSLVDTAELARLREPVLDSALASTTPLCWGFCSLQDAMMLLLSPSRADPRFGLAPDEPFALGRVAGEVLWLDRSLRRPGPGSVETERGHESLRWAIFMHGAVLARPTGAGVVDCDGDLATNHTRARPSGTGSPREANADELAEDRGWMDRAVGAASFARGLRRAVTAGSVARARARPLTHPS